MGRLLNQIKEPNDIKRISPKLYPVLAEEIRDFLLNNVSQTGGHLASNLGAVEITMALHICLRFPEDKVVYDVGHQSYVHKILTGRKDEFSTLRQKDGLCGFPKRSESECDVFGTGHSSTSISAALGLAVARDLEQKDNTVVAVIGDGALSGGMAYEALNNLSILRKEKKNMIIILNDNKMSISENVGGMSRYLNDLRSRKSYSEFKENVESALNNIPGVGKSVARTLKKSKDSIKQLFIPGMLFENMGITYYGLVNGHDIYELIHAINRAKQHEGPILIHAITRKGMGYKNAEKNPEKFHGIGHGRIHHAGEGFDHLLMEGKLLMEHLSTLTEGDEVILTTLWGEDHYRVSGFAVIVPDDIASVMIQPGRELLTLLSCHPYASGGKYRFLAICEKEISEVVP